MKTKVLCAFIFCVLMRPVSYAQVIAAGAYHSLSNCSDNTARSWGRNEYGQIGDGTTTNRWPPVQVNSLTGIVGVAGGQYHSNFLKNDGTVWACGGNSNGQLGDGTTHRQMDSRAGERAYRDYSSGMWLGAFSFS